MSVQVIGDYVFKNTTDYSCFAPNGLLSNVKTEHTPGEITDHIPAPQRRRGRACPATVRFRNKTLDLPVAVTHWAGLV